MTEFGRYTPVWLQAQQELPAFIAVAVICEQSSCAVRVIWLEFQLHGERTGNSTAAGSIVFSPFSAEHSSGTIDSDRWRDFTPEAILVSSNTMRRIAVKIPVIDWLERRQRQPYSTKQNYNKSGFHFHFFLFAWTINSLSCYFEYGDCHRSGNDRATLFDTKILLQPSSLR